MDFSVLAYLDPRIVQAYMCMDYNHKGCDVSRTCHGLVLDQNTCDNAYLTRIHHVVFFVDQETEIHETGLLHNTS